MSLYNQKFYFKMNVGHTDSPVSLFFWTAFFK